MCDHLFGLFVLILYLLIVFYFLNAFEKNLVAIGKTAAYYIEIGHAAGDGNIAGFEFAVLINNEYIDLVLNFIRRLLWNNKCILHWHCHFHFTCFTVFQQAVRVREDSAE